MYSARCSSSSSVNGSQPGGGSPATRQLVICAAYSLGTHLYIFYTHCVAACAGRCRTLHTLCSCCAAARDDRCLILHTPCIDPGSARADNDHACEMVRLAPSLAHGRWLHLTSPAARCMSCASNPDCRCSTTSLVLALAPLGATSRNCRLRL